MTIYMDFGKEGRFLITHGYNKDYFEKLRQIRGAMWDKNVRSWSLPFTEESVTKNP